MKIWLASGDCAALFKVSQGSYVRVNNIPFYGMGRWNKRFRINEVDVISLASSTSYNFPPDFIPIYYADNIKYWHELKRLIRLVCA